MRPGFSFKNTHCSKYNLIMRSVDRTTLPPLRKRQIVIPGRHGTYDLEGETYDNRIIQVECFLKENSLLQLRQRIRSVAAWLTGKGPLQFDDEPDKHYEAKLYNQIPLEQVSTNGIIPLAFECSPFAYSDINILEVERTGNQPLFAINSGTYETPAEFTITNTGENPVNKVRIKVIQTR